MLLDNVFVWETGSYSHWCTNQLCASIWLLWMSIHERFLIVITWFFIILSGWYIDYIFVHIQSNVVKGMGYMHDPLQNVKRQNIKQCFSILWHQLIWKWKAWEIFERINLELPTVHLKLNAVHAWISQYCLLLIIPFYRKKTCCLQTLQCMQTFYVGNCLLP